MVSLPFFFSKIKHSRKPDFKDISVLNRGFPHPCLQSEEAEDGTMPLVFAPSLGAVEMALGPDTYHPLNSLDKWLPRLKDYLEHPFSEIIAGGLPFPEIDVRMLEQQAKAVGVVGVERCVAPHLDPMSSYMVRPLDHYCPGASCSTKEGKDRLRFLVSEFPADSVLHQFAAMSLADVGVSDVSLGG